MTAQLVCHCGREIRRQQECGFEQRLNTLCYTSRKPAATSPSKSVPTLAIAPQTSSKCRRKKSGIGQWLSLARSMNNERSPTGRSRDKQIGPISRSWLILTWSVALLSDHGSVVLADDRSAGIDGMSVGSTECLVGVAAVLSWDGEGSSPPSNFGPTNA